ncbi:MAG: type II toxin-antitoxin system death-on-curing family toxin [Rhodobacteraceae bacterium]|jgi:death-on-curing protein|nr:type II toxin-antitoxin system death-on-curing family toxin [Paracoccaceae bacterium]MBL4556605.1 type II toxin-antitoxin system death-on-curing family toxin [Paracoccaceae bacterium]
MTGSGSGWRWVGAAVVRAVHERQLSEHGGPEGVRDPAALDSALSRAPNLAAYGDPDGAALAAAYAWGILRNHPFADGNKRTAWVTARLFLADNGCRLSFVPADAVRTIEAAAAGEIDEAALAAWFRDRLAST